MAATEKDRIEKIRELFNQDIRLLDFYTSDIGKSILELYSKVKSIYDHIQQGGSIGFESKGEVSSKGVYTVSAGIEDNEYSREIISFVLNKKMEDMDRYKSLSTIMSFIYLMSTFEAKFMDIMTVYFESISYTFDAGVTVEQKSMEFAYKSLRKQIGWLTQHTRIDLLKILGKESIEKLIEIKETRNIYIHNSGIINSEYLRKVVSSSFTHGHYRIMDSEYLNGAKDLINIYFYEFSNHIIKKIGVYK